MCIRDRFKGRESYNLNRGQVIKSYYGIGEDLDKYMAASYVLEPVSYTHLDVYKRQDYEIYLSNAGTGELSVRVKGCLLYTSRCV